VVVGEDDVLVPKDTLAIRPPCGGRRSVGDPTRSPTQMSSPATGQAPAVDPEVEGADRPGGHVHPRTMQSPSNYAVAVAVIACRVRTVVSMSSTSNWLSNCVEVPLMYSRRF
jgi:hypothetical protein